MPARPDALDTSAGRRSRLRGRAADRPSWPDQPASVWIHWLHSQDVPADHIARVLDAPQGAIEAYLANPTNHWVTAAELDRMRELRAAGKTFAEIGQELGRHRGTVWLILKYGVSSRAPTGPPPRRNGTGNRILGPTGTRVRLLHELGHSAERIATILDLDLADVHDFIERCRGIRKAHRARVRYPCEQRALKPPRPPRPPPAPKPKPKPSEIAPAQAWRYLPDVGPAGVVELPATAAPAELITERRLGRSGVAWVRWLNARGLPADHIAEVLTLELSLVTAWLDRASRRVTRDAPIRRELPALPATPPRRKSSHAIIRGGNGLRVRRLIELEYAPEEIAAFMALDLDNVRDFMRTHPIRKRRRRRRRARVERTTINLPEVRRPWPLEPGSNPPEIDPAEAWRYRDDVGPDARVVVPVAAASAVPVAAASGKLPPAKARSLPSAWTAPTLAEAWRYLPDVGPAGVVELPATTAPAELVDLVNVETPPVDARPAPDPWTGPTSANAIGEAHGSAKLTEGDVLEIRRLHGEGQSMYSLAREFKVSAGNIRAIVRRETWTHL